MKQEQQTIKSKCDSIVENTQGLIDKELLLDNYSNNDTSIKCEICKKGFITAYKFESFDKTETSEMIFCSNAMCWYSRTLTSSSKTSVVEVSPIGVSN